MRILEAGRAAPLVAVAALALLAAFPDVANASCPVCFDRDDEARIAFLATTGLLTLLPLGLVVGAGMWLRRRAREVAEKEEGEGGGGGGPAPQSCRDEVVDLHDGS